MSWRYIADDGASAAGGLAFDEALMRRYQRGTADSPPTLRLYTYENHAALVGRFQNIEAEIDFDACARTETAYNRRPTGGGAIVMGRGQLGVAVVTKAPVELKPKEVLIRFSEGIVKGLAELGITASFRGKNDLEVAGRKIAGLGLYFDDQGAMLFHSSVLADLDVAFMLEVLKIPAAKLGDKAVDAVKERVTTVSDLTGEVWDGAKLRDVVASGFALALDITLHAEEPTGELLKTAKAIEETKYRDEGWLFQRSPGADSQGSALFKTPHGLMRVYLALDNDVIKSALFAGDFNVLPQELNEIEAALKWARLDPARVSGIVNRVCEGGEFAPHVDEITQAIVEAGSKATERVAAAPVRLEGSCYYPEAG